VHEFRAAAERVSCDTEHAVFQHFPRGCCKLASFLLARFLYDRGFGKAAYVWGNRATKPGEIDTHGWLRLDGLLIDVTGDQFPDGPGPVFLAAESRWHRRFRPLEPFLYDKFMRFNEDFAAPFADLYKAILGALPGGTAEDHSAGQWREGGEAVRADATVVRMQLGEVRFRVIDRVGADPQLVHHAVAAIAMVWTQHVDRPTEFTLEIGDALANGESGVDANGVYVPEHHWIGLAIGPRSSCASFSKLVATAHVIRVAAHEATHAVQCERAGGPAHFQGATLGDPAYNDHPTEVEAHRESVDVLKGYFPEMRGSVPTGGRLYLVPDESHYTEAWRRVANGETPVRVLNESAGIQSPSSDVSSHS
jgi:hypothetical protein